jgi:hypothetical protein
MTDKITRFNELRFAVDVDQARAVVDQLAVLGEEFVSLAPVELSEAARIEASYFAALRELDAAKTHDEYFGSLLSVFTDETEPASQRIGDWAELSCPLDVYRLVPKPERVMVCLPVGLSKSELQEVLERVQYSTGRGIETDLVSGVGSIGQNRDGFTLSFVENISSDRRTDLIERLSAPPVERIFVGLDSMNETAC